MPQTKPIVSVENVVASASVDQKIDLNDVTKKFPDTEYHPDQFPGLVFRLESPRTATVSYTHLRAHETREDRGWRGGRGKK